MDLRFTVAIGFFAILLLLEFKVSVNQVYKRNQDKNVKYYTYFKNMDKINKRNYDANKQKRKNHLKIARTSYHTTDYESITPKSHYGVSYNNTKNNNWDYYNRYKDSATLESDKQYRDETALEYLDSLESRYNQNDGFDTESEDEKEYHRVNYYSDDKKGKNFGNFHQNKGKQSDELYSTIMTIGRRPNKVPFINPSHPRFPNTWHDQKVNDDNANFNIKNILNYQNSGQTPNDWESAMQKFVSQFDEKGYPLDPSQFKTNSLGNHWKDDQMKMNNSFLIDPDFDYAPFLRSLDEKDEELVPFKSKLPPLPNENYHFHNMNQVKVPMSYPVLVPVPQPYPVKIAVPKPVAVAVFKEVRVPVERMIPYPVIKKIPYPVEKHVPVPVERRVPVMIPKPIPVPIPIIKTVYHDKQDRYQSVPGTRLGASRDLYHFDYKGKTNHYLENKPWRWRAEIP